MAFMTWPAMSGNGRVRCRLRARLSRAVGLRVIDIEARRKIEAITVGLNVRGTLQEPRLTFFSDPSMPQTQIASYLPEPDPNNPTCSWFRTPPKPTP